MQSLQAFPLCCEQSAIIKVQKQTKKNWAFQNLMKLPCLCCNAGPAPSDITRSERTSDGTKFTKNHVIHKKWIPLLHLKSIYLWKSPNTLWNHWLKKNQNSRCCFRFWRLLSLMLVSFFFSFLKNCLLMQWLSDSKLNSRCLFLTFSNNTMLVSVNVKNILLIKVMIIVI